MTAWRKKEVDGARLRQEKRERQRDWEERCDRTRKRIKTCEAAPIPLDNERVEGILYGRETDKNLRIT